MRFLKDVCRSAAWGWIALGMVHISAAWTGIGFGFGWLTCGVASVLGLSGVIGLILVNIIV